MFRIPSDMADGSRVDIAAEPGREGGPVVALSVNDLHETGSAFLTAGEACRVAAALLASAASAARTATGTAEP